MKFKTKNALERVICTTDYDAVNNWIICKWEGYANVDAIKSWGLDFLHMVRETNCAYLLNDDSESTGPWTQAVVWIEEELIPQLISAGLQYYAHVVSANTFSEMSAKELNVTLDRKLEMSTFKTVGEAREWLKSKQGAV